MPNVKQIDSSVLRILPRPVALKLSEIIRSLAQFNMEDVTEVYAPSRQDFAKDIAEIKRFIYALPTPKSHKSEIRDLQTLIFSQPTPKDYDKIISSRYETIFVPAGAMTSTATNGATYSTYEYETNDINVNFLEFDGATEEFAEFQFPMPEQWDLGTLKAKFFWTSPVGSTAGDTVEWEIQAGALSDNDAIDAALGTSQVISDILLANSGADLQISGATPAITVGGTPALGDLIHFKVSRNVGGTDDMAEDAWLYGCLIQYMTSNIAVAW